MSTEQLDKIAEDIGEITTPRDDERDKKEQEEEVQAFDLEEYCRNLDEYEGGWSSGMKGGDSDA